MNSFKVYSNSDMKYILSFVDGRWSKEVVNGENRGRGRELRSILELSYRESIGNIKNRRCESKYRENGKSRKKGLLVARLL